MLKVDASKLIAQLQKLEKEITGKLEVMVRTFTYETIGTLIDHTPLGDSAKNADWYALRGKRGWESYGLQQQEGFAQGSWQALTSKSYVTVPKVERYGASSGEEARAAALSNLASYQLGNILIIGNKGPYIKKLEDGYSEQAPKGVGIVRPSLMIVQSVYSQQLKVYYDKGLI